MCFMLLVLFVSHVADVLAGRAVETRKLTVRERIVFYRLLPNCIKEKRWAVCSLFEAKSYFGALHGVTCSEQLGVMVVLFAS